MLCGLSRIAWVREDWDVEWAHDLDSKSGLVGDCVGCVQRTPDGRWNGQLMGADDELDPDPEGTGTFSDIMDAKKAMEGAYFGEDPADML